jgi:hypothetical protein
MGEVEAYLTALPQAALDSLYADPWTCQAVFRCTCSAYQVDNQIIIMGGGEDSSRPVVADLAHRWW